MSATKLSALTEKAETENLDDAEATSSNCCKHDTDSPVGNQDISSISSLMCRICYDDTLDEPILSLCQCKGSVALVHKSCLERWLAESNTNKCDLCHQAFETERTPKYTVAESLCRWLRYPPTNFAFPIRDLRSDLITCLIILPVTFLIIYVALYAADYYNRSRFMFFPVAKWTACAIMLMGIAVLLGFSTWMYLVLKYHCRVWFFWWQRETYVRVQLNKDQHVT